MQQINVILNVHGGAVQDVFCSDAGVHVKIVDWDVQESDPDAPGIVEVDVDDGRTQPAYVGEMSPCSFAELAGTDVEKALLASELAHDAT